MKNIIIFIMVESLTSLTCPRISKNIAYFNINVELCMNMNNYKMLVHVNVVNVCQKGWK